MDAGRPDTVENEPRGRSLADGLGAAARRWLGRRAEASARAGRRVAVAMALLIAAGPLVTLLGAEMLAARAHADAARIAARLAPRMAAERTARQAREAMAAALARPMLGATLETIARALPANAVLVRAERMPDGALELEIAAPDPDQLRPALRALPGIGAFRDTGQRQGDSGMIATFRAEAR